MTRGRIGCVAVIAIASAAAPAGADPGVDLSVRRAPIPSAPQSLAMRDDGDADSTAAAGGTAAPVPAGKRSLRLRVQDSFAQSFLELPQQLEQIGEKVVFHLNVGVGLDGGEPTSAGPLATPGEPLGSYYEELRTYTFGDAVLGSRGLVLPSMSTYFSAQFRLDHSDHPETGAIPTVYDGSNSGSGLLTRYGYAELSDTFETSWLRPLFIRAGRQFRYGGAIAHFDGLTVGYDTPAVSAGLFSGRRVSLYGIDDRGEGLISGSNIRVNLYRLRRLPVVLEGRFLEFDDIKHFEGQIGLRFSPDVTFRGKLRSQDGSVAQEHASVRARLSKVTTVHVTLDNRHARDWAYDIVVAAPSYDGDDPRRFLALGAPLARLKLAARAGTVLFDNLDLLVRAAVAREHGKDDPAPSAFSPSYFEGGVALEMQFRRSLRVGGSFLARRYRREESTATIDDLAAVLERPASLGERSFYEGDLSLQYNLGAKQFSARAELYTRAYQGAQQFPAPDILDYSVEFRSGARFTVEGWAGDQLRLKGEYETAFLPEYLAPELRGAKSLRIIAEAVF
jgi:hypothetical protein